jgi:hypothetical protein
LTLNSLSILRPDLRTPAFQQPAPAIAVAKSPSHQQMPRKSASGELEPANHQLPPGTLGFYGPPALSAGRQHPMHLTVLGWQGISAAAGSH